MSLLPSGAIETGGYDINNSLRFRSSASAYLNRTPASAGNRQIMTYSFWVKRGALTADYNLTNATTDASNSATLYFNSSNNQTFDVFLRVGATNYSLTTSQVFRDPSAWYHIVVAIDTTQATSSNRTKVYVNGSQVTNFLTANYVPQNSNLALNNNVAQYIGYSNYFDGYMAEVNFIDGQALTPSSFGSTNSTTGVWQPAKYTGTYGTNGFYLPFGSSYFGLPISATSGPGFSTYAGSFVNGTTGTQVNLPANATNLAIGTGDFTVEGWVNTTTNGRGSLIGIGTVNSAGSFWFGWESNTASYVRFGATDVITSGLTLSSAGWVHIAVTRSGSTVRLYKNGSLVASGTSSTNLNLTDISAIGGYGASTPNSYTLQGSISNLRLVVGTALYTGSTYTVPTSALTAVSGTQLLTLQNATLKDNSTNNYSMTAVNPYVLDASGNGNSWQPNNINVTTVGTTYDSMTDVPTNTSATVANYCVLNPLGAVYGTPTFSNANLTVTATAGNDRAIGTIFVSSGKWYWEATAGTVGSTSNVAVASDTIGGYAAAYRASGGTLNLTGSPTFNSYTSGDIIGVALDIDSGTVAFYKNGVQQGTGFYTYTASSLNMYGHLTYFSSTGTGNSFNLNFGQRPFAYTPPTGYKALNTYNLPDSTIKKGNSYMDATTYTGNGTSGKIVTNSAGFKPDFVWIKDRSAPLSHGLFDSVRGAGYYLISNSTAAQSSFDAQSLQSFNSNGFTVGSTGDYNSNNNPLVAWQWQAGQGTTSSNTNGSITSTVSVNASAGFSVVTYTGNGVNSASVGHGLGVKPAMVIIKSRSLAGEGWVVWQKSLPLESDWLRLNETGAYLSSQTRVSAFSSTTFTLGATANTETNGNGSTYVAYCWAEIAGFSKFGSYTGNGSSDGPFVYLGFRPKYVMIKLSSVAGENWYLLDSARNTYNPEDKWLIANGSGAEGTVTFVDFLSNGFKVRSGSNYVNYPSQTFIFAAFAENPFKNSLAR